MIFRRGIGRALPAEIGDERLGDNLAAEDALPGLIRADAAKQILLETFEIKNSQELFDRVLHPTLLFAHWPCRVPTSIAASRRWQGDGRTPILKPSPRRRETAGRLA